MSQATVSSVGAGSTELDEGYDAFEKMMKVQIQDIGSKPLFVTGCSPEVLWEAYLYGIDPARRQHYNCHSCRRFIQKYGGLVTLDERGTQVPVLWNFTPPPFFAASVQRLQQLVYRSKVAGVFLSSEKVWGIPVTGKWTHLSGESPSVFSNKVVSDSQMMACRLEEHNMLSRGLADYNKATVDQAVRVLEADALDRNEKTLGVAQWLAKLHESLAVQGRNRNNVIWYAVATAPVGFAHVRSPMISTLLADIVEGMPFEVIKARWAQKMHPLQYQRPQAPPKEGNIKRAEELVAKLGVANSLLRRRATLDDVLQKLWVPRTLAPAVGGGGVFDHLYKKPEANQLTLPPVKITWEKFLRTVIPDSLGMEVLVPPQGSFYGLVTAQDPTAPAIIQWDGLEGYQRNPVSWYFYAMGSRCYDWNLSPSWTKVSAVFLSPHRWQEPAKFEHQGVNVHFALDGCRDQRKGHGLALFPEILRSEYREIRSVIEAHSNKGGSFIDGDGGNANGLAFQRSQPVSVRVMTAGGQALYVIDRMD